MKIGSLFDGSGGFPLAFAMCGGEPVWRSEVEPYPIAVTKSRFPNMVHLGDVQKVNGAEVEPVDVMTFGSPCQDLSVRGKRAGLKHEANGDEETTRSGLFMEPIRIIKEMRRRTDGLYPTFAVWENVPGRYSSNKGEDFKVVLEELARIKGGAEVTIPKPDKWRYAGCIEGDGWSIAWRTVDAQYWGIPQRRKRIYLVADFGGQRAAEILFKRDGLQGYSAQGGKTWQTAAACAEGSTGADDSYGVDCWNQAVTGDKTARIRASAQDNDHIPCVAIAADIYNLKVTGNVAVPLTTAVNATGTGPTVIALEPGIARRWGSHITENITGTLRAEMGDNQTAVAYSIENHPADSRVNIDESGKCQTLTGRMGTGGGNVPTVMHYGFPLGFRPENVKLYEECATTLCNGTRAGFTTGVVISDTYQKVTGPLMANSHPGGYTGQDAYSDMLVTEKKNRRYIVRRLTPTECARLQGFPDRWGHPDKKESLTDEEYSFWQEVRDTYAGINGKQKKQYSRESMLKWYNKLHTDSSEYKMWGNGIALPNALYVMQGIAQELAKEKDNV